jgi:hypothetical protein
VWRVRFIQLSQAVRWPVTWVSRRTTEGGGGMVWGVPLKVSPLLSSTSIGEPWAAVNSERGSWC